jgi:hypothetical protein
MCTEYPPPPFPREAELSLRTLACSMQKEEDEDMHIDSVEAKVLKNLCKILLLRLTGSPGDLTFHYIKRHKKADNNLANCFPYMFNSL